jgi:HD-GYP domain
MRIAKLDEAILNKTLATAIKLKDGSKLVNAGLIVTEKIIERLKSVGLNAVYIEDDNSEIQLQETLDDDKRADLLTKLEQIFKEIEKGNLDIVKVTKFIRYDVFPHIKNEPVSIPTNQIMNQDDYITHSLNVAVLALRTAYNLEMNFDKLEQMTFIALLHDIGKLLKQKDSVWKDKPHYEVAYQFLKTKNCPVLTYMSVRLQEETFDGCGPYKTKADKQIDFAKILSICDYYENLLRTTDLMPYECFEAIQALVNTKFDPEVFSAFRDSIYIYPVGLTVRLNNKAEGVVVRQNQSYPLRPVIKTQENYYNLMENLSLFIEKVAI